MSEQKPTSRAAIALRGVDIGYGGDPVVRGVELRVREGELHVLLGESGSGKTTLLRAIAGFEAVSSGRIELFGECVDDGADRRAYRPPEKRGVGVVFQDYALFPHLDVARNVAFGMRKKDARAVSDLLEHVGLRDMERRHVSELSGGQQQRVALARALAQEPRIILLDEPFSNLNRQLRDELRENTADILRARSVTAIFVTHDRNEAFALADRVSVVGHGRVLQTGTSQDIYQRPVSQDVASSVGDVVVLTARIDETGGLARCALGTVQLGQEATPGQERTIVLRPEQLSLEPEDVGRDPDEQGLAVVERVVYYGPTEEIRVRIGKKMRVIAHCRPGLVAAGDRVRLRVRGTAICV